MSASPPARPRVFMLDLLATVPYYTAYLSKALLQEGVALRVGSISYYLDSSCFSSRGISLHPGLLNLVGRLQLPQGMRRGLKLAEAMINLAALSLRFAVLPPDVLHIQYLPLLRWLPWLEPWFLRFSGRRGAKLVLTVHDVLPHDTGEAHRAIFHRLYGMADKLICHSAHIRTRLEAEFAVPPHKIAVIPHGPFFYDLPQGLEPTQADRGDTLVLWQGILFPYKGVDLLLDAWKGVEAQAPCARLVVAGTGSPELLEAIRAQVARLGLERVLLDFRFISSEELVALYRAARIVVYPYRAITTSGALATGLALGKTILASDLPVFRELLVNRVNALLVDSTHPAAITEALLDLIQHPQLCEQLATEVRAMNFGDASWQNIAHQTATVYDEIVSS